MKLRHHAAVLLGILSSSPFAADNGRTAVGEKVAAQPNLILQVGHIEEIVGKPSVSPDGTLAVSMDKGRTVIVWDAATGRQLRRLIPSDEREGSWFIGIAGGKGSTHLGYSDGQAAISPDGKIIAATAQQGVTLWSIQDGRKLRDLKLGSTNLGNTQSLAFSPDGKRIVVPRSVGAGLVVFDVASGDMVYETGSVFSGMFSRQFAYDVASWSPDGKFILAASGSDCPPELARTDEGKATGVCAVRVFSASDGSEVATVESLYSVNKNSIFSPDGGFLLVNRKGALVLVETATWTEVRKLPHALGKPAFSPDGNRLAIGSAGLTLIDLSKPEAPTRKLSTPFPIEELAWTDNQTILAFGKLGHPRTISLSSDSLTPDSVASHNASTVRASVAVDSTGKMLAMASGTKAKAQIDIWDLRSGLLTSRLVTEGKNTFFGRDRTRLIFGRNDSWLAYTGAKGIEVWDLQSATKKLSLPGSRHASLSRDGQRLAASLGTGGLRVYETSKWQTIGTFPNAAPTKSGTDFGRVAISPEGRWVAGHQEGKGGTVRIWDVNSGQELSSHPSTGGWQLLQFDSNGRLFYLGDYSSIQPLAVWNVERGENERPPAHIDTGTFEWTQEGTRFALCCSSLTEGQQGLTRILDTKETKVWPLRDSRFVGGQVDDLALFHDGRHIAITGSDGTVRILTQETGELLITLLALPGSNDWLAFTPDGLFDGTPGGWDALLWRFSDELYDVAPGEAFFNEFYRPGLLAEIMAGSRPAAPRSLAQVDRRQPKVSLQATGGAERIARVRVDIAEIPGGGRHTTGSGARDVRLFRNGSLIKSWKGEVTGGKAALEANVPIIAGENRFTAYAFNRDNVKSADARATLTGADSLKRPATAWVLAFGINRYANSAFNLSYSVADAQAFSDQLKTHQTALGLYQNINVVTVKDQEATKANLLAALRRLAGTDSGPLPKGAPKTFAELKPAQPEDAVFIFFAGHGIADGPRFYLLPHDLGYAGGSGSIDATAKAAMLRNAVSDLELEAALETLDAGRLVLTIDACNSGQALEAEERRRGPMNSKGLAQLAYEKGMYVITAAQSHQAALEFEQLGHGLLTFALIKEGLAQGQADAQPQDGKVDVREWLDYAARRVPQLQLAAMRDSAERGRKVAVVRGEETEADPLKRSLQQPRIFYRREPERTPFVVGGK